MCWYEGTVPAFSNSREEIIRKENHVQKEAMNRKEFFKTAGKNGVGACLCCGAVGGLGTALAELQAQTQPGDKTAERAVKRFFDAVGQTLDEETRKKLMMLNGKTCYRDWIRETKQEIRPIEFEA